MPCWSFHVSRDQVVENAGRFVSEGGAEVMKCEGNQHHAPNIEAIVKAGIPVQGHIGVTPMRMPKLGGFKAQVEPVERPHSLQARLFDRIDAMAWLQRLSQGLSAVAGPATFPQPVLEARVSDGWIEVRPLTNQPAG